MRIMKEKGVRLGLSAGSINLSLFNLRYNAYQKLAQLQTRPFSFGKSDCYLVLWDSYAQLYSEWNTCETDPML